MSYIKHYLLGREEACDGLVEEIKSNCDFILGLWGIDTDGFLYDVSAPLIGQPLAAHFGDAIFNLEESRSYEVACLYLGKEIVDRIAAEHDRRQPQLANEGYAPEKLG